MGVALFECKVNTYLTYVNQKVGFWVWLLTPSPRSSFWNQIMSLFNSCFFPFDPWWSPLWNSLVSDLRTRDRHSSARPTSTGPFLLLLFASAAIDLRSFNRHLSAVPIPAARSLLLLCCIDILPLSHVRTSRPFSVCDRELPSPDSGETGIC